jgi:GNAT superfamily N-acetyltransferase
MVRDMTVADLPAVAELSEELGYPCPLEELTARFALLAKAEDSGLFVAEREGVVIGFLQVGVRIPLESPIHAEILALSVTDRMQRTGAGRALVDRAVAFTRERGLPSLRVRSNVTRDVSHVFYTQLGFERKKTQHVYALAIS